jgi:RNA polymerase sigma-70 factor (ECF subfamily)
VDQIAAIRSGTTAAFEEVYYAFHEKLYFYFLKRTTDADVATELVQLTFIKLWRYRSNLNEELPLSQQIFRIARTTLIDVLRHKAQHRSIPIATDQLPELPDTSHVAHERETRDMMHRAIEHLSPERKKIIQYRINGFSNREIAAHLSISLKTVENQVNRAIKQLKEAIVILLMLANLL